MSVIRIGQRTIGAGQPTFIVAEAGVNHNGSEDRAHALIDAAADAGADGVKFQTFEPAEVATKSAPKAKYQELTTGMGTQLEMISELALSVDAQHRLAQHARSRAIMFLSTAADRPSVKVVASLGVQAFKVASADLTNTPLLLDIARERRPVILSTGMSDLIETREALAVLRRGGAEEVILLHCVSAYPAPPEEMNLHAMETLRRECGVPVGLSDHTLGTAIALAAVTLGACLLEKHFTLDRRLPGPDHAASIEPGELAQLVSDARKIHLALGSSVKSPVPSELVNLIHLRKSIVARRELRVGTTLTEADLALKRPGGGMPPSSLDGLVGRRLLRNVAPDELITVADLE